MKIKILGTGCKKCQTLEAKVRELVTQNRIEATIEKITDINDMMSYGIMMTPGLVINEEVKSTGIIPKDDQIIEWMKK
jgi:small redox-active disulfide protein 2